MKFTSAFALLACAAQVSAFAPVAPQHQATALNGVLGKDTGKSAMDPAVIGRYRDLAYPSDKILAEYVWVDAAGNTRSKTRTLPAAKVRFHILLICFVFLNFDFRQGSLLVNSRYFRILTASYVHLTL